jgi:hypothetical protein
MVGLTNSTRLLLAAAAGLGLAATAPAALARPSMHYQIAAVLDPEGSTIRNDLTITIPVDQARAGAGFFLGPGYQVSAISAGPDADASVTSSTVPFPSQHIEVRAKPGSRRDVDLRLTYAGPLGPTGEPPINAISARRIELSADSFWFPIPERFSTRFTLDGVVTGLPAGSIMASPDAPRVIPGGFALHRPKPSTDIAFTAGPGLNRASRGDLQFVAADLTTPQALNYQLYGAKALGFLESWLGPLPTGKATVAIVRRANGTGYSRPGYLVVADISGGPLEGNWAKAGYVAHELSHGWWSNADFMGEDYWLVESTAEYSAIRFLEHELGPASAAEQYEKKRARSARGGPILGHGRPSDDAVYARGPLLLAGLESAIGRPVLDRILAGLAKRETITTHDFLDALNRAAGPDAAREFEAKLRAP